MVKSKSFANATDSVTTEDACGFWACIAAAVTAGEVPSGFGCGVSELTEGELDFNVQSGEKGEERGL